MSTADPTTTALLAYSEALETRSLGDDIEANGRTIWYKLQWNDLLIPAPKSISIFGQLTILSTKVEFGLMAPQEGWKHVSHPKSFSTTVLQLVDAGYEAFDFSYHQMKNVQTQCGELKSKIKLIVNLLNGQLPIAGRIPEEEYADTVKAHLPIYLADVKKASQGSAEAVSSIVTKFQALKDLTMEINLSVSATKAQNAEDVKNAELKQAMLEEQRKAADGSVKADKEFFDDMKSSHHKAYENFRKDMDDMPGAWKLLGITVAQNSADTVTSGLMSMLQQKVSNNDKTTDSLRGAVREAAQPAGKSTKKPALVDPKSKPTPSKPEDDPKPKPDPKPSPAKASDLKEVQEPKVDASAVAKPAPPKPAPPPATAKQAAPTAPADKPTQSATKSAQPANKKEEPKPESEGAPVESKPVEPPVNPKPKPSAAEEEGEVDDANVTASDAQDAAYAQASKILESIALLTMVMTGGPDGGVNWEEVGEDGKDKTSLTYARAAMELLLEDPTLGASVPARSAKAILSSGIEIAKTLDTCKINKKHEAVTKAAAAMPGLEHRALRFATLAHLMTGTSAVGQSAFIEPKEQVQNDESSGGHSGAGSAAAYLLKSAQWKVSTSLQEVNSTRTAYAEAHKAMKKSAEQLAKITGQIAQIDMKKIDWEKIRLALLEAVDYLNELTQNLRQLVSFFKSVEGAVSIAAGPGTQNFINAAKVGEAGLKSGRVTMLQYTKQDIFKYAIFAASIEWVVSKIAVLYMDLYQNHIRQGFTLLSEMRLTVRSDKGVAAAETELLEDHSTKLQKWCSDAQKAMGKLLDEELKAFDEECTAREEKLSKAFALVGKPAPQVQQAIAEAKAIHDEVVRQEVEERNASREKAFDW